MRRIILFVLLSLFISYSNGQIRRMDSLKLVLQNQKTDTGRVNALCDLAFTYFESRPDTAMTMALEALTLSRNIGYIKGEAASLNRVANSYSIYGGNEPKQLEILLQALKLNETIKNYDGLHRNNNNIGVLYNDQEDYRQAINYFLKAKYYAEKDGDKPAIATSLVNIGFSCYKLGQLDSAIVYEQQAQNAASEINDHRMMGNSYRIMGDISTAKNQFELAVEYYRLSFPHLLFTENYLSISEAFLGIANVFEKSNQHDSAHKYGFQSYQIARERGFLSLIRDGGRFLSMFYRKLHIADSAFYYQDITKAANDSLFSLQKSPRFQSLAFEEKMRQADLEEAALIESKKRNHNLQYTAIAIGLIFFIILFFALSHSIVVKTRFISFFAILGLLAVFEFINLFIHPYLSHATNDSPVLMLLVLIAIGALLIPLHHKLEKWITNVMTEKNKKIRLDAAKKTIATLEPISNETLTEK